MTQTTDKQYEKTKKHRAMRRKSNIKYDNSMVSFMHQTRKSVVTTNRAEMAMNQKWK